MWIEWINQSHICDSVWGQKGCSWCKIAPATQTKILSSNKKVVMDLSVNLRPAGLSTSALGLHLFPRLPRPPHRLQYHLWPGRQLEWAPCGQIWEAQNGSGGIFFSYCLHSCGSNFTQLQMSSSIFEKKTLTLFYIPLKVHKMHQTIILFSNIAHSGSKWLKWCCTHS